MRLIKFPLQQRRGDVGIPHRQNGRDAAAAHRPQGVIHILRSLIFHGEHRRQLVVDGQKHAGFQVNIAGQAYVLLPHERRRSQQDGLAVDRAAEAALLIEAEILCGLSGGVFAHRTGRRIARASPQPAPSGGGGGIGGRLAQLLAVDLHAVEPDGPRREQVGIRQDQAAALAHPGRTVPTGHGAAAFLLPPGQPCPRQPPAEGQGKRGPRRQDRQTRFSRKSAPRPSPKEAKPRKHHRRRQNQRQEHRLPSRDA